MAVNVTLSPCPILQFFDNAGNPAVGGTVETQVGGVDYPTYSDAGGTTALPNPIPLNSRGEISTAAGATSELFLETGVTYTFILKDANGNQLWSKGDIVAPNYRTPYYGAAAGTNTYTVTISSINAYSTGMMVILDIANANTGASTLNINGLGAINIFAYGAALVGGELSASTPALLEYDGTQFNIINPQPSTGSFTGTFTGFSGTVTATCTYTKIDGMVMLNIPTTSGTSNTTAMTMTGLPTAIQPTTTQQMAIQTEDSGAFQWGVAQVSASGTVSFSKTPATSAFTASGTKGVFNTTVSYKM